MPTAATVIPLMDESCMMHGSDWAGESCEGWIASEKFNGVSLYWNGAAACTKSGNYIELPHRLWSLLPGGVHCQAEVWAGYAEGALEAAVKAVRWNHWTDAICLKVFDVPQLHGTWSNRMTVADEIYRAPRVETVKRTRVQSLAHLADMFCAVAARGGEGLMLREPGHIGYQPGRTRNILKFKAEQYRQLIAEFPHLLPVNPAERGVLGTNTGLAAASNGGASSTAF